MDMESWMACQPVVELVGLVGGVVVAHDVHVEVVGDVLVDRGQELAELDGAVAAVQFGDYLPGGDVERGEQAGHAVTEVVVRASFGHAGHHRRGCQIDTLKRWLFSRTPSPPAAPDSSLSSCLCK